MGDLACTRPCPLRLGWKPRRVYAQLQKIYTERPDGKGGMARAIPGTMRWSIATWRLPVAKCPCAWKQNAWARRNDTWYLEVWHRGWGALFDQGNEDLWHFRRGKEQSGNATMWAWRSAFRGHRGIFEAGLPIVSSRCWPPTPEHAGQLGERFGCATRRTWLVTKFCPACVRTPRSGPSNFSRRRPGKRTSLWRSSPVPRPAGIHVAIVAPGRVVDRWRIH